ncbi:MULTISPECIES: hypothetical protein [unclassified Streptomyces]|uniref:hypothetical protein n=1 Tax=unclassified Streptomyces TaxID=2593676 RepID=UPI001EEF98C8|nr:MULTISPECIES: hypothetical protein [unclassified Streptomyces]
MTRDHVAGLIGGAFGAVFIEVNAGSLPPGIGIPLRVLAIAAVLGLLVVRRRGTAVAPGDGPAPNVGFGRRYWWVVAAEGAALLAGLVVINSVLHAPGATVGWIAFVVGVHFFGLAAVWHRPSLRMLGGAMAVCGLAGLILAGCGAPTAAIATTSGIAPGVLLLASVWWSVRPTVTPARPRA